MVAHAGIGEDGDVLALAHHLSLIEGADVFPLGDLFAEVIEQHVLEEEHRIVIADRRLHQALGIGGGAHCHNLDAGHGMKISLQTLAVLSA